MWKAVVFAACAAFSTCAASADATYPTKPIRWIVPYAAGGPTELIARLMGQRLSRDWGQQVIVDLRPGANSIIGTEIAARAQPDGYTMLMALPALVINPHVYRKLPYSVGDFTPITNIATAPYLMLVNASLKAETPGELIALARARPGQLNFGSGGTASPAHLAMELFMVSAGVTMTHVPYKGGAPALTDLIAGRIQVLVNPALSAAPHVRSGKLRAIAVTGAERSGIFPDLPTVAESGLPGYEVNTWYGLFAPAKTPRAIVDSVAASVRGALEDQEVRRTIVSLDAKPLGRSSTEFAKFVRSEERKWESVAKKAGITLER